MSDGEIKYANATLIGSDVKGSGNKQNGEQWTRYIAKFQIDGETRSFTVFHPIKNTESIDFTTLIQGKTYNLGYAEKPQINKNNQSYLSKTVFKIMDAAVQIPLVQEGTNQQQPVSQAVQQPQTMAPVHQNPSPQTQNSVPPQIPHKPVDIQADIRLGQALNLAVQILLAKDKPINQEAVFDAVFKTTLPLITALREERDKRVNGMIEAVKSPETPIEQEKSDIYQFIKAMDGGEGVDMEALTQKFGDKVDGLVDQICRNGDAFWVKAGKLKVLE